MCSWLIRKTCLWQNLSIELFEPIMSYWRKALANRISYSQFDIHAGSTTLCIHFYQGLAEFTARRMDCNLYSIHMSFILHLVLIFSLYKWPFSVKMKVQYTKEYLDIIHASNTLYTRKVSGVRWIRWDSFIITAIVLMLLSWPFPIGLI